MNNTTANRSKQNHTVQHAVPDRRQASCQNCPEDLSQLVQEITTSVGHYCRNRPRVVAGTLFALGFIVGWKTKPW